MGTSVKRKRQMRVTNTTRAKLRRLKLRRLKLRRLELKTHASDQVSRVLQPLSAN